jgi:hypothetical protein
MAPSPRRTLLVLSCELEKRAKERKYDALLSAAAELCPLAFICRPAGVTYTLYNMLLNFNPMTWRPYV